MTARVRQTVFDTTDARALAEFSRQLLGWHYRTGQDPPAQGEPDPLGSDWLNLHNPDGGPGLAFQQVERMPRSTWPDPTVPQQLHLDISVDDVDDLIETRERAERLGARVLYDRFDDPQEPLFVLADPQGHPFCLFVG
jgi:catechol 2,3-dioxygenase-like lactoylglutathione lyase family enzyme